MSKSEIDITDICYAISKMDKNSLRVIINEVNDRNRTLDQELKAKFSVGDIVVWEKEGKNFKGKIQKIMPKNIMVFPFDDTGELDIFTEWKIHPSFLEVVDQ